MIYPFGRRENTFDGVTYAPGAKFHVIKEGANLTGWTPEAHGSRGWRQELHVGDVVTCTGFGPGAGSDPGRGVEFTSEQSEAAGAFHCEFRPATGGIWSYRPAPGYLEAADAIWPELPDGFRWATAEETERAITTGDYSGMRQVRVGGTDDEPLTDLAVRDDAP